MGVFNATATEVPSKSIWLLNWSYSSLVIKQNVSKTWQTWHNSWISFEATPSHNIVNECFPFTSFFCNTKSPVPAGRHHDHTWPCAKLGRVSLYLLRTAPAIQILELVVSKEIYLIFKDCSGLLLDCFFFSPIQSNCFKHVSYLPACDIMHHEDR